MGLLNFLRVTLLRMMEVRLSSGTTVWQPMGDSELKIFHEAATIYVEQLEKWGRACKGNLAAAQARLWISCVHPHTGTLLDSSIMFAGSSMKWGKGIQDSWFTTSNPIWCPFTRTLECSCLQLSPPLPQ